EHQRSLFHEGTIAGVAAMTAEVSDERHGLAKLANQIVCLGRPAVDEVEAAMPRAAELLLDRPYLVVEPQRRGSGRVRAEVQDLVANRIGSGRLTISQSAFYPRRTARRFAA
ncbi:MAG TPA: hypothetical protein VFD36_18305, partial [Kofleriaceae bacterium]|nr:hypothetical protein [Kofleriaceae bacterium]